MSGVRLPKQTLPAGAVQVRNALDTKTIVSAEQLQTKLDGLGLDGADRTRAAVLALGSEPDRYDAATMAQICTALGTDEATLRATADRYATRLLSEAKHLSNHAEIDAWLAEPTGLDAAEEAKVDKPTVTKVASAIADGFGMATAPFGNAIRRSSGNRFERKVTKQASDAIVDVKVGRDDFDAARLTDTQLGSIGEDAHRGLDALLARKLDVTDAKSGEKRPLTRGDVVAAHRVVDEAVAQLAKLPITADPNVALPEILSDPKVAGFLVRTRIGGETPTAFLSRFRQALAVLDVAEMASPSKGARKAAETVRKGQAEFNDKVDALVGNVATTIRVAGKRGRTIPLRSEHLTDLVAATAPLIQGLADVKVGVEDPTTGLARKVSPSDIAATQKILGIVADALKGNVIEVDTRTLSLDSILAKPEVAAKILEHAAPSDKVAFQKDYHRAVGTLLAQREAYYVETSWPALTDPDDAGKVSEMGPVVVAVRRQPPEDVTRAMEALTHEYFQGITHLWFDDVMSADPATRDAAQVRLSKSLDDRGQSLLRKITNYRDDDASHAVAVKDGQRLPRFEEGLKKSVGDLTRSVAERTARTAYYCGVSEDTAKEVLRVVGIGMVLGKGLDYGASLLENPAIEFWKPTVLGGWDDILGGWVNVKELMSVADKFPDAQVRADRRAGAAVDGIVAVGAGVGSSVALGLPLLGGKSLGEAMLAPGMDAATRAGAAAFYGAASSGATAVLSLLPARHHVKPILNLVEQGIIEPPTSNGKPLQGIALKAWALRHAVKAHLSYTAQMGGALGVVTSAIFMAATSPVLALPSALGANLVLSLGGAFETITTGAVLYGRRKWDDRGVKNEFKRAIADLGDPSATKPASS